MDLRSLLNNAQSSLSNTYDTSVDQLIDRLGLERQRSQSSDNILPAIGIFSAGLAVGAILGLVFAPKRGEELRGDINDQIDGLRDRIDTLSEKSRQQYDDLRSRGAELIDSAKAKLPTTGDVEQAAKKVGEKAQELVEHAETEAKNVVEKASKMVHKEVEVAKEVKAAAGQKVEEAVEHLKK